MIKQMLKNSQGLSYHKCTSDTEEGSTYVAQRAGMPVLRRFLNISMGK